MRKILISILISSLVSAQAFAAKSIQVNLDRCLSQLAYLYDEDNSEFLKTYLELDRFERLLLISKSKEFPLHNYHLDDKLDLAVSRDQAREIYAFTLSLWPGQQMKELAKALAERNVRNISDRTFQKQLKYTRGWLRRLRSAAIVLSADNEPSKDLHRMVVVMGRVRDEVKKGNPRKALSYVPELQEYLSSESRKFIANQISKFKPISQKKFKKWLSREMKVVERAASSPVIMPDPFHEIRKFVGSLTAILGALDSLDPNQEYNNYLCFWRLLIPRWGERITALFEKMCNRHLLYPRISDSI